MKKRRDSERRAVTLYPEDWKVVEAEARRDDTNVSAALRRIVREWKQKHVTLSGKRNIGVVFGEDELKGTNR